MAGVLVDTSIIIDFLRQNGDHKKTLLYLAESQHELYASILTHAESYAGKSVWEKKSAKEKLEKVFSNIKILYLDEDLSQKAGEISAQYKLEIVDAIIAATAMHHKLHLATLNIKDFKKIKGIMLFAKK